MSSDNKDKEILEKDNRTELKRESSQDEIPKDDEKKQGNEKTEKITLSKFFDIIGQIDIILRTETSVRYEVTSYPFNGVPPGEIVLHKIDTLPMKFGVFVAGDNDVPWIYTKFDEINHFTTFDDFIRSIWIKTNTVIKESYNILVCPPSTIWVNRNPDPDRLGYPTNLILNQNAMVYDMVNNIINVIMLRDRTMTLVDVTVCGDSYTLQLSNDLLMYSDTDMNQLRDILQLYINLRDGNQRSTCVLQNSSLVTHFNPIFDFRWCPSMYRGLPLNVQMSYSLTCKSVAPRIPIQPINDSIIIKQSQGSATRSGFISDVISTQYHESMSTDFAAITSTLLTPGYVQLNIDWSDVPSEAVELNGFISILCKSIFMRSNSQLDSITDESARRVEVHLVELGLSNNLFIRADDRIQDAYPLNNVNVMPRRLDAAVLLGLRTGGDGSGWMNSNRNVRAQDGFDGIYQIEMEHRPVYAVDCSNFDQYMEDENAFLSQWRIYRSLERFALAWASKNSTLSEIVKIYLRNILRYIIRMNEYLSTNFYTGLRLPANISREMQGQFKRENCIRVSVKAKSILAFAKSIGHLIKYTRETPILQQINVETACVQDLCFMRGCLRVITGILNYYNVNDEYGRQKMWSMVIELISLSGHSPLLTHLNGLKERKLLGSLNRVYGIEVEATRLYQILFNNNIVNINNDNASLNGYVNEFYYRRRNFRSTTIEELRELAASGNIRSNVISQFDEGPYFDVTVRGQLRPWLREYACKYRLDVGSDTHFERIHLPLKIDLIVNNPCFDQDFPLKFVYQDTDRKLQNSIEFQDYKIGILKIKTNDIARPDNISSLAASVEMIAINDADFNSRVMRLTDFIANLNRFTCRITILRDTGAKFTSMLEPLPIG